MTDGTRRGFGPLLWLRWGTLRSRQGEGTTLVVLTAHTLTVVEGVGWVPILLQCNGMSVSQDPLQVTDTHLDVKECVVVVPPVSPHPVLAVTTGPVDVLAVGKVFGL